MSLLLSLLFVFLLTFDASLVAARPRSLLQHRQPLSPLDVSGLNTNAKRFAQGLPPLPPLLKRKPTGVDTARRAVNSQCSKSGVIRVTTLDNLVLGYVSKDLLVGHYSLTDLNHAGAFSSSVDISGQTDAINLRDVNDGTHFLAGLINSNQALGDKESKAAVLGRSLATNPGDSPQSNKEPSINNRHSATAIWSYNHNDDSLTANWVNYVADLPFSTVAYISYLPVDNKFVLTNSRTPPTGGLSVLFKYISVNDQCGA